MEATALRDIWNRFHSELPPIGARRGSQPPEFWYWVQPAPGKVTLIRARIDWREQTGQFVPSYTADPMLQIYIGSRALALELSAPILMSNQDTARDAVSKLFSAAFGSRNPTVVVVLDIVRS